MRLWMRDVALPPRLISLFMVGLLKSRMDALLVLGPVNSQPVTHFALSGLFPTPFKNLFSRRSVTLDPGDDLLLDPGLIGLVLGGHPLGHEERPRRQ